MAVEKIPCAVFRLFIPSEIIAEALPQNGPQARTSARPPRPGKRRLQWRCKFFFYFLRRSCVDLCYSERLPRGQLPIALRHLLRKSRRHPLLEIREAGIKYGFYFEYFQLSTNAALPSTLGSPFRSVDRLSYVFISIFVVPAFEGTGQKVLDQCTRKQLTREVNFFGFTPNILA